MLAWLAAPVLARRLYFGPEGGGGMPDPARVVQHAARDADQVGAAVGQHLLGLLRLCDEAYRHDRDVDRLADGPGKRHLVTRSERDFLTR